MFSKEQKIKARKADLYSYLIRNYPNDYKVEGNSIRPRNNHSISIKRGYSGYVDFANGEHGNSIDYLERHMGYTVEQAVLALCNGNGIDDYKPVSNTTNLKSSPDYPVAKNGYYNELYEYMMNRGISHSTIENLINKGLIYQEVKYNNIVFANADRDWGEIRGTYDMWFNTYHGIVRNSRNDGFWSFKSSDKMDKMYICESAIDAISLYEIHRIESMELDSTYVSIGGVAKQNAIDRLKNIGNCIIAVDNDDAGDDCRRRNMDCDYIIPINKDWNEDLCRLYVHGNGLEFLRYELPFD